MKDPHLTVVYVAGKFRGKNSWEIHNNVLNAEKAMVDLIGKGYAPICPHKMTEFCQGLFPDIVYLDICMNLLSRSDAIYMLLNYKQSEGSLQELELAEKLGLEIMFEE